MGDGEPRASLRLIVEMGIMRASTSLSASNEAAESLDRSGDVLDVAGLTITSWWGRGAIPLVQNVSLSVGRGRFVGLVGETGCGKSITCLSIARLLPPGLRLESGRIMFAGRDLATASPGALRQLRGRELSMVFQNPMTSLNPTMRVGAQIMEPLLVHRVADKARARERALELLDLVGFTRPRSYLDAYPHELSGGMRQRVAIAMALACVPKLMIADEPTTALDATVQAQVLELLKDVQRQFDLAVLMVSHDLPMVARVADDIVIMYAGRVVEAGAARDVIERPQHPYTRALLSCVPARAIASGSRLASIPGLVPEFDRMPAGCRFHPRCPRADDRCRTVEPMLAGRPEQRWACWHPLGTGTPEGRSEESRLADARRSVPSGTRLDEPREREPAGARGEMPAAGVLAEAAAVRREYRLGGRGVLNRKRSTVVALDDVSLEVRQGETVGIVGESGSGKSTLGRLLIALERPDGGSVWFAGRDLSEISPRELRRQRREFQMIFQDPYSSLDRRFRVGEILLEPLVIHGLGGKRSWTLVDEALERVSLPRSMAARHPYELSGGQQQRVGLARALMLEPRMVVADEPVSGLDVSVQAQVLNLMQDLQENKSLTFVFISHDLAVVRYMSDRIGVMYRGRLVELGPARDVYEDPRHPYTLELLEAVSGGTASRRAGAAAVVESELEDRSGCMFRARCPFADEQCAVITPALAPIGVSRSVACHHPVGKRTEA